MKLSEFSAEFDILYNNIMSNIAPGLTEYEKSVFLTQAQEQLVIEIYSGQFPDTYTHYTVKLDAQNFWFVILESVIFSGEEPCTNGKRVIVQPITYDGYWSIMRNPFRGPNRNRVLRLNISGDTVELISDHEIGKYTFSFLKKPSPIILEDIEGGTIDGSSTATDCKLPEVLHRSILVRAVNLAKSAWGQSQEQQ